MRAALVTLAFSLFGSLSPALAPASGPLDNALTSLRPEAIRAHMAFLADDLLEGRGTGTRGYQLAANYVAAQLQRCGLEPSGDNGSFYQWLDLRETTTLVKRCSFVLQGQRVKRKLKYGTDYLMDANAVDPVVQLRAPLVYVGFGVSAPDAGYDDYEGIDVSGKVVVLLRGAPAEFDHNQRAFHSSSRRKREVAVSRGAVGMVTFLTLEEAAKRPWERTVMNARLSSMKWLEEDGTPHAAFPQLKVEAMLSVDGARELFEGATRSLEQVLAAAEGGAPASFDMGISGHFKAASEQGVARSCNVAALLPGSDAALRHEVVVYSAHLDHLGIGEALDGDRIYNGAYDNASGVSVMLEVARALSEMPEKPRRSIMFLAVTGEEKGLLGSDYFAENPPMPIQNIIANVNLDMFLMIHPLQDLIAFGEEHSTLSEPVRKACARLGVELTPDPMPDEVIFVRSDQYSFVRKGVPAVFLVAGFKGQDASPETYSISQWLREFYHTQRDDMTQYIDFEAGVRFAQVNLLVGFEIADSATRPAWNVGDFFGDRFAPSTASQ